MNVDFTLKNIDIDYETADRIISAVMIEQYSSTKKEIEEQKNKKNLEEYQKEDLKYNEEFLDAVITMVKHYTIHHDWPEELKNE